MNTKTIIATALLTAGLGLGATSTTANAAFLKTRSSTPSSLRGTWYHISRISKGTKPDLERITITKHSFLDKCTIGTTDIHGKMFTVQYHKYSYKFKGYARKQLNTYMFSKISSTGYVSTHLRINGKYRHVMLQTPQQGPFSIYTKFKPAHQYTITGSFK